MLDLPAFLFSFLKSPFPVPPSQNDVRTLKKWMADVDVFLNEEWPALGDSEALEKQLEQCTVSRPTRLHGTLGFSLQILLK